MNSQIKFLHRVRIHGGECGAVARALHHKAKNSSLPAVFKNVLNTTLERKLMSKLIFKRISLAVISALTFGMLTTVSSPVANALDETFTLSASSATAVVGETASVTLTLNFVSESSNGLTATAAPDSRLVVMALTSATNPGGSVLSIKGSDSLNVFNSEPVGERTVTPVSGGVVVDSAQATAALNATRVTTTIRFYQVATPGTYTYTFSTTLAPTGTTAAGITQRGPVQKSATFTLTVTAPTSDRTKSKFWMNQPAEYNAAVRTDLVRPRGIGADSTTAVSAGTIATPVARYVLWTDIRNSSDTATVYPAGTATPVRDTVTVTISGPGLLAGHTLGAVGTRAKSITLSELDTAIVYSDGTPGTATINAYLGTTISSATLISSKTLVFHGKGVSFTVDSTDAVNVGSTVQYGGATDSVTAGTAIVRFVAKDSAGNAISSAALNTDPGEGSFYAISSDTSVLAAGSSTTARKSPALACTYDGATAEFQCSGNVYDSGTVTLTIVDSRTVTPNGANYLTTVSAPNSATAFSVTFAGLGRDGTIKWKDAKSSYIVNESGYLELTCKDSAGRNVANGTSSTCFRNLSWVGLAPTFAADNSVQAAGNTFTSLSTYLSAATFFSGSDTAMVFMPSTYSGAGTFELLGRTGSATSDSSLLKWTVTDPVLTAIQASANAATAAADAATDAAAEAIDAANAATDAANLAAEAADAATVAAEEARDAADAATAAVEELATQVATLMSALKAQITTLANTVAKIAKKVKA